MTPAGLEPAACRLEGGCSHPAELRGQGINASKAAGGYTILASALGFSYIDFGVAGAGQVDQGYEPRLLVGAASTDCTLQWYIATQSASNGTLVGQPAAASATGYTTSPVPLYIIGR